MHGPFPIAILWAWDRPAALVLLVVPLVLALLSLRRDRPRSIPVGTFELWRGLATVGSGERRRRRLTPARWIALAAIVSAILGLAGPRPAAEERRAVWRVIVDPSPSMFVEHTDASGRPTGAGRRLDAALERLADVPGRAKVELEWWRPSGAGLVAGGSVLPGAWTETPRIPRAEPAWSRYDAAGTIWLTDEGPGAMEDGPRRAGVVASGGGPAFGPVGTVADRWLDWEGSDLRERPGAPARGVVVQGPAPEPIATLIELWAAERGLALAAPDGVTALRAIAIEVPDAGVTRIGRDGWSAAARVGRAPLGGTEGALQTWLAGRDGTPVVTWGPGAVHIAIAELEEPAGEPGAFAVSWAKLLDAALLPCEGVVSIGERSAAGPAVVRPPAPVEPEHVPTRRWPWSARLAALAALLAWGALLLGEGR